MKIKIFLDDERVPCDGYRIAYYLSATADRDYMAFLKDEKENFDCIEGRGARADIIGDADSIVYLESKGIHFDWIVCRTVEEAIEIASLGNVSYISFDNDLQQTLEGVDLAKWLIKEDMDNGILTDDFDFFVHSQNVPAAGLIISKMEEYLEYKNNNRILGP